MGVANELQARRTLSSLEVRDALIRQVAPPPPLKLCTADSSGSMVPLAGKFLGSVFCDSVANLVVDSFTGRGPAVDDRNIEQDVVEVRLGDGCPNHASHLVDDSFFG